MHPVNNIDDAFPLGHLPDELTVELKNVKNDFASFVIWMEYWWILNMAFGDCFPINHLYSYKNWSEVPCGSVWQPPMPFLNVCRGLREDANCGTRFDTCDRIF